MNDPKQRPPVAPPAQPPQQEQPFPPGTVAKLSGRPITEGDLDDIEKEALRQAGWKEGMPVPDLTKTTMAQNIQDKVEQFRKEQEDVGNMTPVPLDTPPIQPPEPKDIGDLPPEQQRELQQSMMQAIAMDEELKRAEQEQQVSHVPGMSEAMAVAKQPTMQIVDDVKRPEASTTETSDVDMGMGGFDPTIEAQEAAAAPRPTPEPQKPAPEAATGASLAGPVTHCPKCNHDLQEKVIDFDEQDKLVYVQHIEGAARFEKEYKLFGGRYIVRFRNLTTSESDLIMNQTDDDVASGRLVHVSYVRRLEDYRMVAAISQIRRANGRNYTLPPIEEIPRDKWGDHMSALPNLYQWFSAEVLQTEHLRRTFGMSWMRFQAVLQLLDARSEDPDFYPPIEQQV